MELPSFPSLPRADVRKFRITDPLYIASLTTKYGRHILLGREKNEIDPRWLIYLGKVIEISSPNYSNSDVWLDVNKPHVVFIVGRRGQGKSYDLGIILEGLAATIDNGISAKEAKVSAILFDTMNQFWTVLFKPSESDAEEKHQLQLLRKWGMSPQNIDVQVFVPKGAEKTLPLFKEIGIVPSELNHLDWCNLFGFDPYADLGGQLLSAAFRKVSVEGYTTVKGGKITAKSDYSIGDLIYCIENDREILSELRGFKRDTRRAVIQRLKEATAWGLFQEKGTEISEIYKPATVSIMMLGDLDDKTKALVTGLILRKVYDRRTSVREAEEKFIRLIGKREELTKKIETVSEKEKPALSSEIKKLDDQIRTLRQFLKTYEGPPCWVLLDEAHVMCPADHSTSAKEVLIKFAKRGRDKGLSLTLATQQPSAVDIQLISQKDIMIVHQLGIEADRRAARLRIGTFIPNEIHSGATKIETNVFDVMISSLERGEALIADDEASRVFLAKIRPRISAHGGKEATLERIMKIRREVIGK